MAVVTTAWLTQTLSTKLGVSIGLEMASQLGAILFEKEDLDVRGYDRLVRDEAALKLNEARKETQLALQLAERNDMGREVKTGLFTLSRQLQRSQERVKLSEAIPINFRDVNEEGIKLVNLMVLTESFAILEEAKKNADAIADQTGDAVKAYADGVKSRTRSIERMLDFRRMSLKIKDEQLLKLLADSNPDIFESVRGLATVLFKAKEMKPPKYFDGRYHEKLQGPLLEIVDVLSQERGPVVGLSELSAEFNRRYPGIEYSQEHLERAVTGLCDLGLLESLESSESGYKIVKLKPLKLTDSYQQVLTLVAMDKALIDNGITREEVMQRLGLTSDLSERVLEELSRDDIAWKHESKYYFPGLSEAAYEVKKDALYVS